MTRQLVMVSRCDMCSDETPGQTFTFGWVGGLDRPQLRTIELCEKHAASVVAVMGNLAAAAQPFVTDKQPARPAAAVTTNGEACELCGKGPFAGSGLVSHVWNVHTAGRQPLPSKCPDCSYRSDVGQAMGQHLRAHHGYDALASAYKAARAR